ncbi:putative DNA-binding transcriptional regulator YafY [Breznakia sp. PF5-3]|uniref:helix-turn-helix transcriptional regulator n=1 Tax=unclassified Breznakia TaxID=2623764 RepID=UPI00240652FE|nr:MULTISPECIES: WYL domain-containing protein [unclassified Breznakia]MDF9824446.1 putative DNA-binding transcriptional regulator YafY [Breznakia sp. PM6-1]MDF9835271.1 putative DNA-binding transcriptional regulator YafY [Breznakia sp. PF5-3]MDF9837401.1 putative DNA-binding transcriptional regulator YafY [Breznakia sp. PFB2-8]MDF9859336.1 putative DNA-binding transcriptional regulator YafY [Breznakia sp. PH5-24]
MEEKKSLVLALLDILIHESDENHILRKEEILKLLEIKYSMNIERRTLYSNIKLLQNFGYDISDYKDNGIGYYLIDRQFERSEINLLCHSIHSSHIIPDSLSKDLINKLLSTQNKYVANDFKNRVYAKNYRKSQNKQFFLNIDLLLEAIQARKPINFIYTKYNHKKERIPRREKQYEVSPYDIVYANGCCYLISFNEKYKNLSHYRVDKMKDIIIEKEKSFFYEEEFNSYEYITSKLYMYSGNEVNVLLRCNNTILDDVIDTFGTNTFIKEEKDKNTFIAKITSSKEGIIYWSLQYLKYCTVLEPAEIKTEIKSILKSAIKKYD